MRSEPDKELILTPQIAEALGQLDGALRSSFGVSVALMGEKGELVYPASDTFCGMEDADLHRLWSKTVVMEEETTASSGADTARALPVRDASNVLGALIGYPINGKRSSPSRNHNGAVRNILRAFAGITAEVSVKDVAIEGLSDELSRCYEDLTLLYELSDNMEAGRKLESSLDNIFRAVLTHMQLDFLVVFNPLRKRRKIYSSRHDLTREQRTALYGLESRGRSSVTETGEPWVLNDAGTDERFARFSDICSHIMCIPIPSTDVGVGAITAIRSYGKEQFFMGDVKLISAFARQVAIVMRNARLFSDVRSLFLNLVKSLISIVEAKHKYTRGHSERVNRICGFLAKQLGLRKHAREVLHWASLFHDVGKISVPDVVLNKPGKLTDEEFSDIKQHPVVGYNVLSHIEQLHEALPGIRHHHEKLDGSGYPDGLREEEIPLMARIIAVADVYDALTSTRSYRPAMSINKALEIMREGAGTHFDSRVLNVFLKKHEDIARMLESSGSPAMAV